MFITSKEKRKDENLEKQKIFWGKIKNVSFVFDTNQYTLRTFCSEFYEHLSSFKDKCATTVARCKGRATIQNLKSIIKGIDELRVDISHICDDGYIRPGNFEHALKRSIPELGNTLVKTSKAHFPHLINRSTLDFDLTREEFKRLSKELDFCRYVLVALTNEASATCLLNTFENNKKHDALIKKLATDNVLLSNSLSQYDFLGGRLIDDSTRFIDTRFIQKLINLLKKFNYVKNFDTKIKKLEDILLQIQFNSDRNKYNEPCDCCGNNIILEDIDSDLSVNHGCPHSLCRNCLIKASANKYKCPKCGRKLNKDWVMGRIKEMS